mgnify:CR=1 FL=1
MKILALDIENSYLLSGTWGIWNQNVGLEQLFDNGKVLCYSAKWLGKKDMMFAKHTEPYFLSSIHALLDEADAVLTYNGKKHDIPMLNREFIKAGMTPPSPYKQIDLLETMKKVFKFPSNKLQHVSDELGIGQKLKHEGFELWVKCLQEDKAAWATMKKYNMQDVKLLEKLYWKVQPWVGQHPNHNLYGNTGVCPKCGGKHLQLRGKYVTQTGVYSRLHCQDCGSWSRTRFTEVEKDARTSIYVGAAL